MKHIIEIEKNKQEVKLHPTKGWKGSTKLLRELGLKGREFNHNGKTNH
jgi:hypothetical protein